MGARSGSVRTSRSSNDPGPDLSHNIQAEMSSASGPYAERTVLIVEDNELNMKLFNDVLEVHGYATLQSKDGLDALQIARQHRPDLILMDIQLPVVSGLEITKRLKTDEELRGIPVVAVTAFAMKGDEEKIRQSGCDAYMTKPISIAGLMRVVEYHLPAQHTPA